MSGGRGGGEGRAEVGGRDGGFDDVPGTKMKRRRSRSGTNCEGTRPRRSLPMREERQHSLEFVPPTLLLLPLPSSQSSDLTALRPTTSCQRRTLPRTPSLPERLADQHRPLRRVPTQQLKHRLGWDLGQGIERRNEIMTIRLRRDQAREGEQVESDFVDLRASERGKNEGKKKKSRCGSGFQLPFEEKRRDGEEVGR